MEVKIKLDVKKFVKKYAGRKVTVKQVADDLAISTKSAGRLLAELEQLGLARRVSRRVYEIEDRDTQL